MTSQHHPTTVAATVAALSRKDPSGQTRSDCRDPRPYLRWARQSASPRHCRGQRRETPNQNTHTNTEHEDRP